MNTNQERWNWIPLDGHHLQLGFVCSELFYFLFDVVGLASVFVLYNTRHMLLLACSINERFSAEGKESTCCPVKLIRVCGIESVESLAEGLWQWIHDLLREGGVGLLDLKGVTHHCLSASSMRMANNDTFKLMRAKISRSKSFVGLYLTKSQG